MYKLMGNDMMRGIPKHQQHVGDAIRVGNPRLQCYMCVCIVQYQDSQVPASTNRYKPVHYIWLFVLNRGALTHSSFTGLRRKMEMCPVCQCVLETRHHLTDHVRRKHPGYVLPRKKVSNFLTCSL